MDIQNPDVYALPEGILAALPRFVPREHALAVHAHGAAGLRKKIGVLLAESESKVGLVLLRACDDIVSLVRRYVFSLPPQKLQRGVFRWRVRRVPRLPRCA